MKTTLLQYISPLDFKRIGRDVIIDPTAVIQDAHLIEIGDHTRIDAYCIIKGALTIGSHCHIGDHCEVYASSGVIMEDFVNLAAGVLLLSETDDYSGKSLTGTQIPRPITLRRHVIVGARSTIFPGVFLKEGVAIGAHSLVLKTPEEPWAVYAGTPVRYLRPRNRDNIEKMAEIFLDEYRNGPRKEKAKFMV